MVNIRVPATSANMGPGFDCLGIALSLYNNFTFEETDGLFEIEGCPDEYKNQDNLVYTSYNTALSHLGYTYRGVRITVDCHIPPSRGLGSSASCIAAGITAANEIAKGKLTKDEILGIASDIEGHPDNTTPAIIGGMTAAVVDNGRVHYSRINVPDNITFCALVPEFHLSTKESRAVLPDTIPRKDGVFNTGRAVLLTAAFNSGRLDLLPAAFKDMLHQPYRKSLINNYDFIADKCAEAGGLATFLSGAGPTIMCIVNDSNTAFIDNIKKQLSDLPDKWSVISLKPDFEGCLSKSNGK